MFETIEVGADGALGRLMLNRPEKLNPLSTTTLTEIAEAAAWFDGQPDVKVVVVSGAGRAFSAGADLGTFSGRSEVSTHQSAEIGRAMASAVGGMNALTIASIHGWCVGGAVVLASACDLRVASADARFSIPEVDLGLPLTWSGIPLLVRELGPALTKELVITCRPFDAEEALRVRFVNRVVSADQLEREVDELARQIAAKARYPVWATKRHVNAIADDMTDIARCWADADGLVAAFGDPECDEARREYIRNRMVGK